MITNVLEYIESSATVAPNKVAFESDISSLTYEELLCSIHHIGTFLAKQLNTARRPIAVYMDKCPACLVSFFGIVASGNFYVCIDYKMAPERIDKIYATLNPVAVLTTHALLESVTAPCPIYCYEDIIDEPVNPTLLAQIRRRSIDTDPLYVLYTSGSTGIPKGSVITHKSVIAYAEWLAETFHFDETTIFGNQTPFYFSMSVLDIYSCIKCASTLQIIPKKLFSFPVNLLQYLKEKHINTIYWVPSALCIVANWKALDYVELPELKNILFAGEVMPTKQLNFWRSHLPDALYANLFGPTEITDIALYYILDRDFADDEPLPIGIPCRNMDVFSLTEDGRLATGDELGELYFRGSFVGEGYYYQPDKTATAFVQNPINDAYPEIVYRTGDLVRQNSYGEYVYAGRKDFQIKHMGYRIELGEIESVVSAYQEITSCACLYDTETDRILLFYTGTLSDIDLRLNIEHSLPTYMLPSDIFQLTSMPYNANGKIDRKLLQETYITH